MFQPKTHNEDAKLIVKNIINNPMNIKDHNMVMNETDRTSVGLLFHENIIDLFKGNNNDRRIQS